MTKEKVYLSSLSSLRGIAAILVILFHLHIMAFSLAPWEGYVSHFILKGYLWVDFFFLLSGFIMMHVYSESFKSGIKGNFHKFMRSRFARIYPLHIFSLVCMLTYYFWLKTSFPDDIDGYVFNMRALWTNLLLLHSMDLHPALTWVSASWSISVEWWMYVIFPFLLIPFRKISDWKKIFIFFSIIGGYLFIMYYLHPLSTATAIWPDPAKKNTLDVTYDYGFVRCFFGFLFGMLIYELYRINWGQKHLKKDSWWLIVIAAIILSLSFQMPDFANVIIFGALVLVSVYAEGIGRKLLNLKPLIFLGDISYSLYLMHLPLMSFLLSYLKKHPQLKLNTTFYSAWLWALVFLALVISISTLTYKFIEVPMRQRINRR